MTRACGRCGGDLEPGRASFAKICLACNGWQSKLQLAAYRAVSLAVRSGQLPPVRSLKCVDCGKPAMDYDHRDYNQPLEVEATCRSCNLKRGSAIGSVALRALAKGEGA